MRILLDECLPAGLRHSFPAHEAHTVQYAGFKGLRNGELIRAAVAAGYQVLLTVDQGIPHQQPRRSLGICVVVMAAPTSRMSDLLPLIPAVIGVLETVHAGTIVRVP